MFDTHAHLNFAAFEDNVAKVIKQAKKAGVAQIVIPSSNVENSQRSVKIAEKYEAVYAAVGIHPFHLYGHLKYQKSVDDDLTKIERSLTNSKVVAIGEVGLDKYSYSGKKYPEYQVSEELTKLQKEVFIKQLKLAVTYQKSLIVHNRGATKELLEILKQNWDKHLEGRTVFHFCEMDKSLIEFAKKYHVYLGVDGDVTYDINKQEFVKKIPLDLLVLETDSPYIIPKPLKSQGETINQPANLGIIVSSISQLLNIEVMKLIAITTQNSKRLFNIV